MQGLAVIDGDLVLSGGTLLTLSGANRIKQDLDNALHDQYGSDPLHPYWGSTLERYLGQPSTPSVQQQVVAEVQRILNNYIAVQADMVNKAVINSVRGTLDTSDVIRNVASINVTINGDSILIKVELQTMARESVTITRQVTV